MKYSSYDILQERRRKNRPSAILWKVKKIIQILQDPATDSITFIIQKIVALEEDIEELRREHNRKEGE